MYPFAAMIPGSTNPKMAPVGGVVGLASALEMTAVRPVHVAPESDDRASPTTLQLGPAPVGASVPL